MSDDLQSVPFRSTRAYLKDDNIIDRPGSGMSGTVFFTSRESAIKVYAKIESFERELAAYRRLSEHDVRLVCGHRIPKLLGYDRSLLVDFASAAIE